MIFNLLAYFLFVAGVYLEQTTHNVTGDYWSIGRKNRRGRGEERRKEEGGETKGKARKEESKGRNDCANRAIFRH